MWITQRSNEYKCMNCQIELHCSKSTNEWLVGILDSIINGIIGCTWSTVELTSTIELRNESDMLTHRIHLPMEYAITNKIYKLRRR